MARNNSFADLAPPNTKSNRFADLAPPPRVGFPAKTLSPLKIGAPSFQQFADAGAELPAAPIKKKYDTAFAEDIFKRRQAQAQPTQPQTSYATSDMVGRLARTTKAEANRPVEEFKQQTLDVLKAPLYAARQAVPAVTGMAAPFVEGAYNLLRRPDIAEFTRKTQQDIEQSFAPQSSGEAAIGIPLRLAGAFAPYMAAGATAAPLTVSAGLSGLQSQAKDGSFVEFLGDKLDSDVLKRIAESEYKTPADMVLDVALGLTFGSLDNIVKAAKTTTNARAALRAYGADPFVNAGSVIREGIQSGALDAKAMKPFLEAADKSAQQAKVRASLPLSGAGARAVDVAAGLGAGAAQFGKNVASNVGAEAKLFSDAGSKLAEQTALSGARVPIPKKPTQGRLDREEFSSRLGRALDAGDDAEVTRLLERQDEVLAGVAPAEAPAPLRPAFSGQTSVLNRPFAPSLTTQPAAGGGVGGGVSKIAAGAAIGAAGDEENRLRGAGVGALAGLGAARGGAIGLSIRNIDAAIPQEVRAVGRFGFVRPPETYVLDEALERQHTTNVIASTKSALSQVGARLEESVNGAGLFGGDVSPNSIMRFAADAPDEELRTAAAVRGLAFGQDQQLWYRKARPTDTESTAAVVITGPDFASLPDEAIDAVVNRLRADDALGPYGGATREGNHLLALNLKRYTGMEDEAFQQAVSKAVDEVAQSFDIDIHPSSYYAEHLDGTADYVRTLGQRPDALRAARTAIVDAQPEYLRYAAAVGADVKAAEQEIAARIESIDRLIRQVEQPPPLGRTQDTVPVANAAKRVYTQFPSLSAEADEVIVPEMTTRLSKMVDDLVDQGVIPREMAQDFYRGATLDQRQIARLALPELREDPKYTLYTVVNSILSSGQQVPVETRQGLNVFDQYLRTGRFSVLDPADVQYKTALSGGKKAFTGDRGTGLLGEAMAASPRTLNHEQALARLDALVQALGEDGAVAALVERVPIMAGRVVKEERPSLVYLFGPKIGQYAMDKLGILNDGNKSTIDLWMARLDYALRGDASGIDGNKLNDAVSPAMRRRMQQVLGQYAEQNGMPESSAQALAWYAIKNAFRNAGGREKRMAYATLGSATTDALMTPLTKELSSGPLAQGLVKKAGAYDEAAEGWNDPTLQGFAKRTGREGTIAPVAGALAGKVFDVGGALGEGVSALSKAPGGKAQIAKVGLGAVGYGLSQAEDERLQGHGNALMGLAAYSLVHGKVKQGAKAAGAAVAEELAKSPMGRRVLDEVSLDIRVDPRVKETVDVAMREMAKYRAIGRELASEAKARGGVFDRTVSDLVEKEAVEADMLSPEDMEIAVALAQKIADNSLGLKKVEARLMSADTYAKRGTAYLPRRYAKYEAKDVNDVVVQHKGKTFRISGEKIRNDALTREERDALGEIREASYRIADYFGRGSKDIATAHLFEALAEIPGVIHPEYVSAVREAAIGADLSKVARTPTKAYRGSPTAGRDALRAADAAKARAKGLSEQFKRQGQEYVTLPDTPQLGVLRGAVVRKDAAAYLNDLPDFKSTNRMYNRLMHYWKSAHTVFNVPATHLTNMSSNVFMGILGGLPFHEQVVAIPRAVKDIMEYGPTTRFLTEAGVIDRALPTYGDTPLKGLARDETVLRSLMKTTRPETREALEAQGLKRMSWMEEKARKVGGKVEQGYSLGDTMFRVALFDKLAKQGMSNEDALKEVMRVFPGYDTRSPILQKLKHVSPFVMYPAKYLPAALNLIAEHPWRWAIASGTWAAIDQASRSKAGAVRERDLPPNRRFGKGGYLVPGPIQAEFLGLKSKEAGKRLMFDMARYTPFTALTGSPAPGTTVSAISEKLPGIVQPSGPLADIIARGVLNVDPFSGKPFIKKSDDAIDKLKKFTVGTTEAGRFSPGLAASLLLPSSVSYHLPNIAKDLYYGNAEAAKMSGMGLVGGRPVAVKRGQQASVEDWRLQQQIREVNAELEGDLRAARDMVVRRNLIKKAMEKRQRLVKESRQSRQP